MYLTITETFQQGSPKMLIKVTDPGIRTWIDTEIAAEGGATYCKPCHYCKKI